MRDGYGHVMCIQGNNTEPQHSIGCIKFFANTFYHGSIEAKLIMFQGPRIPAYIKFFILFLYGA
jgi:hypothetical protein